VKIAAEDAAMAQEDVAEGMGKGMARWLRWAERYVALANPLAHVDQLPGTPDGYGWKPIDLSEFGLPEPTTEPLG